ncbi:hypothetical protein NL676_038649 [Syzygium grande]|nr:hypothetical protein NL676_038649 [Syzygium grande]
MGRFTVLRHHKKGTRSVTFMDPSLIRRMEQYWGQTSRFSRLLLVSTNVSAEFENLALTLTMGLNVALGRKVRHYNRAAFHSHREVEQFIVERCWYFGFGVHPKSASAFDKCWSSYRQVLFSEDIDAVVNRVAHRDFSILFSPSLELYRDNCASIAASRAIEDEYWRKESKKEEAKAILGLQLKQLPG